MDLIYKVQLSHTAEDDLSEIVEKILNISYSKESAEKWVNIILDKAYSLDRFPIRNSKTAKAGNKTIWHINVKGKYIIYYEIDDKNQTINIRRIISNKRDERSVSL
ncbi:type II toxin-antitoxin system RelE/ParE family toxin [Candidatus Saccharibacteria bacterium]|nr:type II toxin-antitoxin system RelE/ParE family toxin [Candidatus Saccharibacteria bacterium]